MNYACSDALVSQFVGWQLVGQLVCQSVSQPATSRKFHKVAFLEYLLVVTFKSILFSKIFFFVCVFIIKLMFKFHS